MKYNDNGEWKDITVKALDTLPVGSIVDYEGTTVPSGWEQVNNISIYDFSNSDTDQRKCIKSGNVVQFTWIYSTTIQVDSWGVINLGTLPEEYRPVYFVYGNLGGYCAGEKAAFFYIDPDGTIKLFNWKNETINQPSIFLSCTYITNN